MGFASTPLLPSLRAKRSNPEAQEIRVKNMKNVAKKIINSNIFLACVFVLGIGLLLYPVLGTWLGEQHQSTVVMEHANSVAAMQEEERQRQLELAKEYNETLVGIRIEDPFVPGSGMILMPDNYMEILNVEGIMARIEVPRLNIDLPIFHTTDCDVLDRGVGHIEGTSLPVGGENTHAVLAAHSGLPNRRMFTPLLASHGGIEYGDIFVIRVFGRNLAYEVDQITIVTPYEVENLQVEQDADFVTLVTCTPYAINSHRLLVRGARVEYLEEEIVAIEPISPIFVDLRALVSIGLSLAFGITFLVFVISQQRKKAVMNKEIEKLIEGMH